jgi:hypothetical protein
MIGGDLQELRRIPQTVNLVEYHAFSSQAIEKRLGIVHETAYPGQFAVKILNVIKRLTKHGFPGPPDTA